MSGIAIRATGLITSVGLTAAESCAAFRAKVVNPTQTQFLDSNGDWILAHQVPLAHPWRGLAKLAKMAALAIEEALQDLPREQWSQLPLLLCVAEPTRPGRLAGLDDELFERVQNELDIRFAEGSALIPQGRVGVATAITQARQLLAQRKASRVLVAATDSLLVWPTLSHYGQQDRLLNASNSDGFMPGEAAGALLLEPTSGQAPQLICTGIGFGREASHVDSEEPLRADGLSTAMKAALAEAGRRIQDMDYRITDNSGEHYYFKEAAMALARTLHVRKEEFDIWHPAECTGEIGAASGITLIATAQAACAKQYTKGHHILIHMGNDAGERAALTLAYGVAA